MAYLDEAVAIKIQMMLGLIAPASLTDIYIMIARKYGIPPQKVETSIRSAVREINEQIGVHFTPMTYIYVMAHGEKCRKKMMKAI